MKNGHWECCTICYFYNAIIFVVYEIHYDYISNLNALNIFNYSERKMIFIFVKYFCLLSLTALERVEYPDAVLSTTHLGLRDTIASTSIK